MISTNLKQTTFNHAIHTTFKIKETFIQDFATENNLVKSEGSGNKSVYDLTMGGVVYKTQIVAYNDKYQCRQLAIMAEGVLCFNLKEGLWKFFYPQEIEASKGSATRGSASTRTGECQVSFKKNQGVFITFSE